MSGQVASLLRRFQDPVTMMSLTMAQTIIESLEWLNRPLQSTATLPDWWRLQALAARAVKMRWQNTREQNKFDDVFAIVETREKELARCHLLDRKDYQHVLVDQHRHISRLMYVNISVQNMWRCYTWDAVNPGHCIILWPADWRYSLYMVDFNALIVWKTLIDIRFSIKSSLWALTAAYTKFRRMIWSMI